MQINRYTFLNNIKYVCYKHLFLILIKRRISSRNKDETPYIIDNFQILTFNVTVGFLINVLHFI